MDFEEQVEGGLPFRVLHAGLKESKLASTLKTKGRTHLGGANVALNPKVYPDPPRCRVHQPHSFIHGPHVPTELLPILDKHLHQKVCVVEHPRPLEAMHEVVVDDPHAADLASLNGMPVLLVPERFVNKKEVERGDLVARGQCVVAGAHEALELGRRCEGHWANLSKGFDARPAHLDEAGLVLS